MWIFSVLLCSDNVVIPCITMLGQCGYSLYYHVRTMWIFSVLLCSDNVDIPCITMLGQCGYSLYYHVRTMWFAVLPSKDNVVLYYRGNMNVLRTWSPVAGRTAGWQWIRNPGTETSIRRQLLPRLQQVINKKDQEKKAREKKTEKRILKIVTFCVYFVCYWCSIAPN